MEMVVIWEHDINISIFVSFCIWNQNYIVIIISQCSISYHICTYGNGVLALAIPQLADEYNTPGTVEIKVKQS